MTELGMLQRLAARYSEVVREHAYLVGLVNLAVRTGDMKLLATARERLAETNAQCNECSSALQVMKQQMLNAATRDEERELAGVGALWEYAAGTI